MESLACNFRWLAATLSTDGIIASLSSGAEQFTGYSAEELVGRPVTHILADSTAFEIPQIMDAANQWGQWQGEIVHRTRSGNQLPARGTLSLMAGAGNNPSAYLLLSNLSDASVPEDTENAFIAGIARDLRVFAHDLNNPLAVTMGFAQLLILNANCQGAIRGDIDKLYAELKRVIRVVEKLHAYALSLYNRTGSSEESSSVKAG